PPVRHPAAAEYAGGLYLEPGDHQLQTGRAGCAQRADRPAAVRKRGAGTHPQRRPGRDRGVDRPGLLRLRGPQRADHCGHLGQLTRPFAAGAAPELHSMAEYEGVSEKSKMLGYSPKSAGCKAHERRTPWWNASECNAADGAFW